MSTRNATSAFLRSLLVAACASFATFAPARAQPEPTNAAARVWYPSGQYPQLTLPGGGRESIRSMLDVSKSMQFGDFVWDEHQVPKGAVWIRIDLPRQILSVFRAGHEIGTAVILYGTDGKPTPTGRFAILEKKKDYFSHSYHAPMPYMLRLTSDGVAIHGSNVRQGHATHGCIGVPLDFARLLFGAAGKGDMVVIIPAQTEPKKAALR